MSAPGRRLYIGRLPPDVNRSALEKYFGRYGTLLDVRIMGGYGFLEYDQLRDAEDAVHDLNGRKFEGENLIVEYAKAPRDRDAYGGPPGYGGYDRGPPPRRGPPGGGYRLRVTNLASDVSWQDLKDFARTAGNVTRADVNRGTGEGIIEYGNQADADDALRKLDGADFKGQVVTVTEDRDPPPRDSYSRRDRSRSPRRDDRDRDYERRRSPPPRDRSYGGKYSPRDD